MSGSSALTLENIAVGYPSKRVAQGISTSLERGELTCLLGANGAGKSTLLKTLAAFQPPLEGNILLDGKILKEYTAAAVSRLVGVVLTEQHALRNLTVQEVVSLGRTPYTGFFGRLAAHDKEVVEQAMERVGMVTFAARTMTTLSDGERQKVMIAKALAQETPIILLDEPTAFLDFQAKVEMLAMLRTLARTAGKAVLLSTHDLELALQMADRLWLMAGGCLKVGTVEEMTASGDLSRFIDRKGLCFDAKSKRIIIQNDL